MDSCRPYLTFLGKIRLSSMGENYPRRDATRCSHALCCKPLSLAQSDGSVARADRQRLPPAIHLAVDL